MIRRYSIGKKLAVAILIGFLIPYILGTIYVKSTMETWLYKNNIAQNQIMLTQTAKLVDEAILKNVSSLTHTIASDARWKSLEGLRNYVDFESQDMPIMKDHVSKREEELTHILKGIVENYENISFISIGTAYGGYTEYPSIDISENYDPRERPWYKNALKSHQAVISEPYVSKITEDLVVSISHKIEEYNEIIGVFSVNIKLDSLMENINRLEYGDTGYIVILSPDNLFINAPQDKTLVTQKVDEQSSLYKTIISNPNKDFYEIEVDGNTKIANMYISSYSGWKYISVIDKKEVLSKADSAVNTLTVVYLATTIIALMVLIFFSRKISRPILDISNAINNMASFNFESYQVKNLDIYTSRNDEVGEIATALNNMQSSFLELKNSMLDMDEQIRKIDVAEGEKYNLKLSHKNPFRGVASSINELLNQVYTYKEKINFMAQNDPMTNLPNRRAFNERLINSLKSGSTGGVILFDIDNFKGINDTLGHLFGDEVLKEVSTRLKYFSAENVFLSRFGGDEFLILYECKEDTDEIINFILNIFVIMEEDLTIDGNKLKIEFSMGISTFPKDSSDMDELIRYADLAMYSIKNTSKNNYAFFNANMSKDLNKKLEIREILLEAIEKEEFKVLYQPQVEIISGEIKGYEGLLRLKNHNIPTGLFIEVAEENGLIIPIGRIVTKLIIEQMAFWRRKGYILKPVSINFSAMQIHDSNYQSYLMGLLKENDIDPKLIVIEITEGVFLDHKDTTIYLLNELRAKGIKIAIDDFGTGFSSLSYITSLPIDTIKFDRMLSLRFLEHEDIGVVKSLVSLAHSLNLKVVAEGIEDEMQVKKLREAECDLIQGYYYSRPLEAEAVEESYYKVYVN